MRDLAPFAAVLQCLQLDTPLLEQQNTSKLYRTKNNCVQAWLGQSMDPEDMKRPKHPTTTFEEPGGKKIGCQEQKQGTTHALCTQHHQFSSVHFSRSIISESLQPHGLQHARPPCPSPTPGVYSNSCLSNHLILCQPLLLPPSIFPSIRVFSNESVLHNRWSKYWSFSFSISPSNEYAGLISFRID